MSEKTLDTSSTPDSYVADGGYSRYCGVCSVPSTRDFYLVRGGACMNCEQVYTGYTELTEMSDIYDATPLAVTGSRTLVGTDAARTLELTDDANQTITIPTNEAVPIANDKQLVVTGIGTGTKTVTAAAGVTLNGVDGGIAKITAQWGQVVVRKRAANAWVINGDVEGVA